MADENEVRFSAIFETRAELSGAVSMLNHLEATRGAMSAVGKDTGKIDGDIGKIRNSLNEFGRQGEANFKLVEDAMKGNANEAGGMHMHYREMHMMMHMLGGQSEMLAVAFRALFSPQMAAIMGTVYALRAYHERMKQLNEEMHNLEHEAMEPLQKRLELQREALIRNATGLESFDEKLKNASRQEALFSDEIDQTVAAMKRRSELQKELDQTTERAAASLLDALHTAGLTSEEEYQQKKIALEQKALEERRAMEEKAMQDEIDIRKKGVAQRQEDQGKLDEVAKKDLAGYQASATATAEAESKRTLAEQAHKTALEGLTKFRDAMRDKKKPYEEMGLDITTEEQYGRRLFDLTIGKGKEKPMGTSYEEYKKYVQLMGQEAATAKNITAEAANVARVKVGEQVTALTAEISAKAAVTSREETKKAQLDIEHQQKELDDKKKADTDRANTERAANLARTPHGLAERVEAGGELRQAYETVIKFSDTLPDYLKRHPEATKAEAADAIRAEREAARGATPEEKRNLIDTATRLTGRRMDFAGAIHALEGARSGTENFGADVERLVMVMENLAKTLGDHPGMHLSGRIDRLENWVRSHQVPAYGGG